MNSGGLAMSHINDAGYWIFIKLAGLTWPTVCARGR